MVRTYEMVCRFAKFGGLPIGHQFGMPTNRSARRVLSLAMGIAATFDLTGLTLYETMRPVLPPSPPRAQHDPFSAAMSTIMAAMPEAASRAPEESGETLLA
jgi:uncharacterized iron-regulated membrane protein